MLHAFLSKKIIKNIEGRPTILTYRIAHIFPMQMGNEISLCVCESVVNSSLDLTRQAEVDVFLFVVVGYDAV